MPRFPRFSYALNPARFSRFSYAPNSPLAGIAAEESVGFWPVPARSTWTYYTPELCQHMIDAILHAMEKALQSGVAEYRVGSRGLKRFSLKELQDLLGFWTDLLEVQAGGRARRVCPTDT